MYGEFVRGDVYRLNAPKSRLGHEQDGARLAVVLQSTDVPLSTLIVAPTSTSRTARSFRPTVEIDGIATCVLVEHLASIDPEQRLGAYVGHLGHDELKAIDSAIRDLLDV